jgi:hypothetical protein
VNVRLEESDEVDEVTIAAGDPARAGAATNERNGA